MFVLFQVPEQKQIQEEIIFHPHPPAMSTCGNYRMLDNSTLSQSTEN